MYGWSLILKCTLDVLLNMATNFRALKIYLCLTQELRLEEIWRITSQNEIQSPDAIRSSPSINNSYLTSAMENMHFTKKLLFGEVWV